MFIICLRACDVTHHVFSRVHEDTKGKVPPASNLSVTGLSDDSEALLIKLCVFYMYYIITFLSISYLWLTLSLMRKYTYETILFFHIYFTSRNITIFIYKP